MQSTSNPRARGNQPQLARPHVLITGASSGIGAALALAYASRGAVLSLHGRDQARLDELTARCMRMGGSVTVGTFDIRDRARLIGWLAARDDAQPVDLLIANAGVAASRAALGARGLAEPSADARVSTARDIMEINVLGLIDTVETLIPRLVARQRGHLALMASLAAFRGYASAPAYAASKAAVHTYGQGIRARLRPAGVAVSTIYPGFVDTPLTRGNPFPMPFIMPADRAARIIVDGLDRQRARIAFPWTTYALARLAAMLPDRLVDRLVARAGVKE